MNSDNPATDETAETSNEQRAKLYPCIACSGTGNEIAMGCCGNFDRSECCGNPVVRVFPCPWCIGAGRASSSTILDYAKSTMQMNVFALHEANVLLENVLINHPARIANRSKQL